MRLASYQSHLRAWRIGVFHLWQRTQNKQMVWGKRKHLWEWKESQNSQMEDLSHSKSCSPTCSPSVYRSRLKRKSSIKQISRKRCRASGINKSTYPQWIQTMLLSVVIVGGLFHNEIVQAQMIKSISVSVHTDVQMLGFCIDQNYGPGACEGFFDVYYQLFSGLWNV